jgi:hypothetical protein
VVDLSSQVVNAGPSQDVVDNPTNGLVTPYLIVDHNELSCFVKNLVKRHFNVVDPDGLVFSSPVISFRRAPNLRNMLVNIGVGSQASGSAHSLQDSIQNAPIVHTMDWLGQSPCLAPRCLLCKQLPTVSSLSFPEFNFNWELRGNFSCKSMNCVYLAVCGICDLKYVGETLNFRKRMNGHNSQQNTLPASSFYKHRESTGHVFRDFKLYILRANLRDKDDLRNWEAFFIDRLHTLTPLGLNVIESSI